MKEKLISKRLQIIIRKDETGKISDKYFSLLSLVTANDESDIISRYIT